MGRRYVSAVSGGLADLVTELPECAMEFGESAMKLSESAVGS
jgi:hypothetical protein